MKGLIFTYVMTYGGAVVGLFRPWFGFLIYVCFGLLKPDDLWHWSVPEGGNYSRIVACGFLVGWALNGFGNWRLGRGALIIVAMIAYWFLFLLGAMTADYPDLSWPRVEAMGKVFLPILVGATLINSSAQLWQLAWTIVLSQGYLAFELNLRFYEGSPVPPWEWIHGGLDNNGIAITMVTAVGLAFFLGVHADRWWKRGLALVLAGLMAHVVLFSHSRGGMLALIVTSAAWFILTPRRPRDYLILLVAIAIVIRLAGPEVQQRFFSAFAEEGEVEQADKGGKRLEQWNACWDSIQKRPLGVGPGNWPKTSKNVYGLFEMAAHSTWLQAGAELGLPGLICLVAIYGTCIVRLWPLMSPRAKPDDPDLRYFARMVVASLPGFLLSAQFVSVDGIELPYYIALLGAGTLKVSSLARVMTKPRRAAIPHRISTAMPNPSRRRPV